MNALLHPHDFSAAHEGLFGVSSNDPNYHETGPDPHLAVNPSTPGRRGTDPEPRRQLPLWQLPDTSILFKRYMDAGRLINVYDWYESFVVALETQRRELQKAERLRNTNGDDGVSQRSQTPRTPRTPKRGRKGKERATEEEENVNEDEVEEMTEEDVEKWRIEVQARFMRSYHDLEFMGFIKPTGRKADHVIKTIYDLPD